MRKLAAWILAIGLVVSPAAMAADGPGNDKNPDGTAKTATSDTSKTDKKDATVPTSAELAAELDQLRTLLKEQADQLEEQRQELAAMKASLVHNASASTNSTASAGTSSASANSISSGPAGTAATTPSSIAPANTTAVAAANVDPNGPVPGSPQAATEHSPLSFKIGDAQFTPGGFMDFTIVGRSTGTGNGIGTTFNSIPVNTTNNTTFTGGIPELRFSAQNSRVSLKVDAPVGDAKITGYVEADFLGAIAANANVTSNSDSFRMRLYFGDYRRDKWEILAGQEWSMLTPNRKGIGYMPGDIFFSQDVDTNYQVGLPWTRQPQVRVLYHPNDNWVFGLSIENPDELLTSLVATPPLFSGIAGQLDATSGGTLSTPPTPNWLPDFIFKIANDSKVGDKAFHVEAAGLLSEFRLFTPASITGTTRMTQTATGGGVSLNANLELFKNFHLIANSFYSDGGGRYLLGSGPDLVVKQLTITSPFTPSLVHAASGIGGFEYQAAKNTLFDVYYGNDYYGRNVQVNPATGLRTLGYGFAASGNATDSNNRDIQEYTFGWTQNFWSSPNYGKFSLITQASYVSRAPWALTTGEPKDAHAFMGFIDLRYTLP